MVRCLTALRHYLDQCWLTINKMLWHSFQGNVYLNIQYTVSHRVFTICIFEIPATWYNEFTTWWRHQMEAFSALLAICAGNSTQRPVTWSFDIYCDLRLNKRLCKQSRGWWFETLLCPLWRHSNGMQYHLGPRSHGEDEYEYKIFYKFPCTDLSVGTRWGLRSSLVSVWTLTMRPLQKGWAI